MLTGDKKLGYQPLMPCPPQEMHICKCPCASDEKQAGAMGRIIRAATRLNKLGLAAEASANRCAATAYRAMAAKRGEIE